MEVTLATWLQNKVVERGAGIGAMNKEEESKDPEQEHNHQEEKERGTKNQVIEKGAKETSTPKHEDERHSK